MSSVLDPSKSSVLDRIVRQTHLDLELRKQEVSLQQLRQRVEPSDRDLVAALQGGELDLIAEYKPKSPSMGVIDSEMTPERIAKAYASQANAISVLCDRPFFGGSYQNLKRVRAVSELPLLAKDFVVDPYQIYEARASGADGILLLVSLLEAKDLAALMALAESLAMAALVETHDDSELEIALRVGAKLIGVNSRDLRTMEISLDLAVERLAHIPKDRTRVAESGLRTSADVDLIRPHADAALIGTQFMTAEDPQVAMAQLGWGSQ